MRRMTRDRYLSDAELERFMAAVRARRHKNQVRDYALFALIANTGIRPSEALSLTADRFRFGSSATMTVSRLKKRGPRDDEMLLTRELAEAVKPHITAVQRGPLFPVTRRQCARLFQFYRRRAGVRPLRLYALRHTAATRLYRATRDISIVQAFLGHESAETTTVYAHIPRTVLEEAARTIPPML